MGTTNGWVGGRVVLTTSEWNSLINTPISFKVKVEAYENDVSTLVSGLEFNKKVKRLSGSLTPEDELSIANQVSQADEFYLELHDYSSLAEYEDYLYAVVMDSNITTFQRVTEAPDTSLFTENNIISTNDSAYPIYAWYESGVIKYYSESDNIKANSNMKYIFCGLTSMVSVGSLSNLDTINVTDMKNAFTACSSLTNLDSISNWNVSNVTIMNATFGNCTSLTDITGLANWNVINVTDMKATFSFCSSLTTLDGLANWNTSNVTDMSTMFNRSSALSDISALANWDVSNVKSIRQMFNRCKMTNLDSLANWNVSNVTSMFQTFYNCSNITDASGINDWNVDANCDLFNFLYNSQDYPDFTKFPNGTWDQLGTFTPNA